MDETAKARRVWDQAAPRYDRQIAFLEKHWFTGGREWLGARATGRILDVGVGTGRNLPHYPADATVTGIDLSPAMLAVARRRARRPVELHEGDATRLPFPDGSFDTVVCALSLCTIPDPRAAIGEAWRVLVPGGRLLLLDHIGSSWPPVHAAQWLVERVTVRAAGEHFTRRQLPLVRAAGFEVVEAERLKAGTIERVQALVPDGDQAGIGRGPAAVTGRARGGCRTCRLRAGSPSFGDRPAVERACRASVHDRCEAGADDDAKPARGRTGKLWRAAEDLIGGEAQGGFLPAYGERAVIVLIAVREFR
ncbi:methyltransferase domain-containing protein [Actinoplanes sp. NPDC023936]|uniref:class I SAM-dependent methyltransferase n=1 Tax=Actinoplanes sp. NPDC023936 TaxID=3154910 RepID=UPI00340091F7